MTPGRADGKEASPRVGHGRFARRRSPALASSSVGLLRRLIRLRRFPRDLFVVVQTTVLNGELPARHVAHDDEGSWLIGDAVNEPDPDTNMVLAHMGHVLGHSPHVNELIDMPRSTEAFWCDPGKHWHREPLQYLSDDEKWQPLGGK